jgi:protein O-GlcNAc transferase
MPIDSIKILFAKAQSCRVNGDRDGAISFLRDIIAIEPTNADALNNLGLLLFESGAIDQAIDYYTKAIGSNPFSAEAHCNYATALHAKGRMAQAERNFARAIELKKGLVEAYLGLSGIKETAGDFESAKNLLCDALRIRPDNAIAYFRLGTIMREWDQLDHAIACFRNTIRLNPDHILALNNLGETLQAAGEIEESEKCFRKVIALDPDNNVAHSNLFISMNYNPAYSPREIFNAHCRWGERVVCRTGSDRIFANVNDPERKIRLGYCSSDFCNHPAASFLDPVLKNHDHERFEIICYSQGIIRDSATESFKRLADGWREIRVLTDDAAAQLIRTDAIDILIDCTGHMGDNRLPLFARKSAPVQVSWIGYPNSTGLPTIDFRFADKTTDPPDEEHLYSEKLVYLENGFCCFEPPQNAPAVTSLPAARTGAITFGSLHNVARLNNEVISLWSMTLKQIPRSNLFIFRTTLNDEIISRITQAFAAQGIDAARVTFAKKLPPGGHLAVYDQIDIALDTFPWSGHTTACQALWMGVPVITLKGNRHAGRMVASVLTQVGLADTIAETPDAFISIAKSLSSDLSRLGNLRAALRERMQASRLCDGSAFANIVEREYRVMWRRWCER